jgi:hypothetical protein
MKACARDYTFFTLTTLLTVGIFFIDNITVAGIIELCRDMF